MSHTYIEPWRIESHSDTLTLREEATVRGFVLGGGVALGVSLVVASVDYWLWRRETIEGVFAAWLGFASALLAAKAIEQFIRARCVATIGPRCLTFRREDRAVELQGYRDQTNGRIERIAVEVRLIPRDIETQGTHLPRKEFTVLLVVDGERLELGTYGAEAAANRLAETIARWVGIKSSRLPGES